MNNVPYSIFLDDLRSIDMVYPYNSNVYENFMEDFHICRTMEDAVKLIEDKGFLPYYISFDNDLGQDQNGNPLKEGIDFAHWIVESILDNNYNLPVKCFLDIWWTSRWEKDFGNNDFCHNWFGWIVAYFGIYVAFHLSAVVALFVF